MGRRDMIDLDDLDLPGHIDDDGFGDDAGDQDAADHDPDHDRHDGPDVPSPTPS